MLDYTDLPYQNPVTVGVLGVSRFALKKSLPRMAKCPEFDIRAIASRSFDKAVKASETHGIPNAVKGYDALLDDPSIEAVYIPLPISMHAEWTIKALRHGKHVLCEKPIACNEAEARAIFEAQLETDLIVAEATMIRHHPQWKYVKDQITSGRIGELKSIVFTVTYDNDDPQNIRNIDALGGGALLSRTF